MQSSNRTHREIIEDISEGCGDYCILKEILLRIGLEDRTLEQIKCIEMFKYEGSSIEGRDIGWDNASKLWEEEGYAEKFSKFYENGMRHNELYALVIGKAQR